MMSSGLRGLVLLTHELSTAEGREVGDQSDPDRSTPTQGTLETLQN